MRRSSERIRKCLEVPDRGSFILVEPNKGEIAYSTRVEEDVRTAGA